MKYDFGSPEHIGFLLTTLLPEDDPLRKTAFVRTLANNLKGPRTPEEYWTAWHSVRDMLVERHEQAKFRNDCLEALCNDSHFIRKANITDSNLLYLDGQGLLMYLLWPPGFEFFAAGFYAPVGLSIAAAIAEQLVGRAVFPAVAVLVQVIVDLALLWTVLNIMGIVVAIMTWTAAQAFEGIRGVQHAFLMSKAERAAHHSEVEALRMERQAERERLRAKSPERTRKAEERRLRNHLLATEHPRRFLARSFTGTFLISSFLFGVFPFSVGCAICLIVQQPISIWAVPTVLWLWFTPSLSFALLVTITAAVKHGIIGKKTPEATLSA